MPSCPTSHAHPTLIIPRPEASWSRAGNGEGDTTIEENWLFRLRRERFRSRLSGREHDFYVMHLADAVHAIALTPDDQVVLVRQFRAGSAHDSLEPPGGLLEPGEDPREAGARELLEETGYAGDPAVFLSTLWSNPSIVTSRTTTIVIRNVRRVAEPKLDHNEEVAVELVAASDDPPAHPGGPDRPRPLRRRAPLVAPCASRWDARLNPKPEARKRTVPGSESALGRDDARHDFHERPFGHLDRKSVSAFRRTSTRKI